MSATYRPLPEYADARDEQLAKVTPEALKAGQRFPEYTLEDLRMFARKEGNAPLLAALEIYQTQIGPGAHSTLTREQQIMALDPAEIIRVYGKPGAFSNTLRSPYAFFTRLATLARCENDPDAIRSLGHFGIMPEDLVISGQVATPFAAAAKPTNPLLMPKEGKKNFCCAIL